MKKFLKTSIIFVIAIMIILSTTVVNAALTPGSLKPTAGDLTGNGVASIGDMGRKVVGIVQTVGVVVAVVILLVLGIKYMMGSAEEKAEYKKSMIPYIVGAVLIFASTTVVNIVYEFATSLSA